MSKEVQGLQRIWTRKHGQQCTDPKRGESKTIVVERTKKCATDGAGSTRNLLALGREAKY
jgi:hypothetical protein